MIIKAVEFGGAIGAPGGKQPPGALPQVVFAGRSNVGKSSLINMLLGRTRKRVARVSATPGKTREVNFYRVRAGTSDAGETEFFLVDLPGYGFARAPAPVRAQWHRLIEDFLQAGGGIRGVVQLVDMRHGPTRDDARMVEYLARLGVPAVFVLTKADKLSRPERARQLDSIIRELEAEPEQVICASATSGEGRAELLDALERLILDGGDR
jgi:GTP-binding protein